MGRCATCGKWMNPFGDKWRRLDGAKYCLQCAPDVMELRRQATMDAIMTDSMPEVVLAAPVISRDLDYPSNHRRYTGVVLLTGRGVIFAQHGEYKKAQSAGALVGGLLGAAIDALVERRRRHAALSGLTDADCGNAMSLLEQAEQVFFFKLDDIKKIKANNRFIELKLPKRKTVFRWTNGRQSIKPRRILLDAYAHAVNLGRDVMGDCVALVQP